MNIEGVRTAIGQFAPAPFGQAYAKARSVGHHVLYHFGQPRALDNSVKSWRNDNSRQLARLEAELVAERASAIAIGEIATLKRFSDQHAPENKEQFDIMGLADPPEPFALKQLEQIWHEEFPNPEPDPAPSQANRVAEG